jgi:hypothetical protein
MLKRVDVAVYNAFMDAKNDKFTAGFNNLGLKEGGVDYAMDDNNKPLVTAGNEGRGRQGQGRHHRRHRPGARLHVGRTPAPTDRRCLFAIW